jgi:hypothetical protein
MAELRLTITVRQKRGLLLLLVIVGLAALVLALMRPLAAVWLGIAELLVLWAYVMYARAFTECTPDGIRTRGLGGQRQCSWPQVANIRLHPRSRLVVVTTRDGRRFWLGVPVDGGVMPDPEFTVKFKQVVRYWHAAPGSSAGEGEPATSLRRLSRPWWL